MLESDGSMIALSRHDTFIATLPSVASLALALLRTRQLRNSSSDNREHSTKVAADLLGVLMAATKMATLVGLEYVQVIQCSQLSIPGIIGHSS